MFELFLSTLKIVLDSELDYRLPSVASLHLGVSTGAADDTNYVVYLVSNVRLNCPVIKSVPDAVKPLIHYFTDVGLELAMQVKSRVDMGVGLVENLLESAKLDVLDGVTLVLPELVHLNVTVCILAHCPKETIPVFRLDQGTLVVFIT